MIIEQDSKVQIINLDYSNMDTSVKKPIVNMGIRQIRLDCKSGFMRTGAGANFHDRPCQPMIIRLVAVQMHRHVELFGYKVQDWIQISYLDDSLMLANSFIKTESIDNFLEVTRQAMSEGKDIRKYLMQMKLTDRKSSKYGTYYVVDFTLLDNENEFADTCIALRKRPAYEYFVNVDVDER